jgi:hypothetical protein
MLGREKRVLRSLVLGADLVQEIVTPRNVILSFDALLCCAVKHVKHSLALVHASDK